MTTSCSCGCGHADPHQVVREGTAQDQRALAALDPRHVPVDERRPEHHMVFAAGYARHLTYYDPSGSASGDWQPFFASDVSVLLAVAATEDVAAYRTTLKALLRSLEDPELPPSDAAMVAALGGVFDCLATLAVRLDDLALRLPADQPLRATLGNLIRTRLGPMMRRLIGYHGAGLALGVLTGASAAPAGTAILGQPLVPIATLLGGEGLRAPEWPASVGVADWAAYAAVDPGPYSGAYGTSASVVDLANHLVTHNLFAAVCDTFLAVFARVVDEARSALDATLEWPGHEPHYALFLAFLQLLEHARAEANTFTARHLDFYYRGVLGLSRRPAEPAHGHVLVELARHVDAHLVAAGTRLRAGKDDAGRDAHVVVDADLAVSRAAVVDVRHVYLHHDSPPADVLPAENGRMFASVVADAATWHPFAEKVYADGVLTEVSMPRAEVGFAVASPLLRLAGGKRRVVVDLATTEGFRGAEVQVDLLCRLTTADGWLDQLVPTVAVTDAGLRLELEIGGNEAPVVGYDPSVHGYGFATAQPVLLVVLRHQDGVPWRYHALAGVRLQGLTVHVAVTGLRSMALSNDHGPVDASKPFLAFGSVPLPNSALVVGSKEVFGKAPHAWALNLAYLTEPVGSDGTPTVSAQYLDDGAWQPLAGPFDLVTDAEGLASTYEFGSFDQPAETTPDPTPDAPVAATSRAGYVRLVLSGGFGTDTYPIALATWLAHGGDQPTAPVLPTVGAISLDYEASRQVDLDAPTEAGGRLFHVAPFGHAEASAADSGGVPLLPEFRVGATPTEGELYLGVRDLRPPATLALLCQVVDGTENPLVVKPTDHVRWAYLRGNSWVPFSADAVADGTAGLLASGVVTLAVPADADAAHTLLPSGLHWLRLAVASRTDAVSRLRTVAAQALRATSARQGDGTFPHTRDLPPGTIVKLDPPDAEVKAVAQPYPMFGGRPDETPDAFATRVSERLRHKDRAIALWDYERLVLEAFPGLYQVRCLTHTRYEPSASGTGSYSERAAGHVTVVTIPDLRTPNPLDPLRPATSLRVLGEVEAFLAGRMSCFATLHVRNPQFEEVRVDLRVRFRDGADESLTTKRLQRDLTAFLSPWAVPGGARPTFNGVIHKSVVVDFVEERPYVDFVSDVRLFHRLPGATADGPDLAEVVGSRAVSILVSVPPHRHGVHPLPATSNAAEPCGCPPTEGASP